MILSSIVCRIRPKNVPGPAKRSDTAGVRLHSYRKNASAAKPQEAVQADRHSSKRKSLILSSLPQKSGVCLSANAKTQLKKSDILPFRAVSIIPYSGLKTSMRACSGKSPAANPASAETLFLFIQRDGMVFILGPGGIRPHRYPLILQQLIHLGD